MKSKVLIHVFRTGINDAGTHQTILTRIRTVKCWRKNIDLSVIFGANILSYGEF